MPSSRKKKSDASKTPSVQKKKRKSAQQSEFESTFPSETLEFEKQDKRKRKKNQEFFPELSGQESFSQELPAYDVHDFLNRKKEKLRSQGKLLSGTFHRTSKGTGIVHPDQIDRTDKTFDVFIPQFNTADAADGDFVSVELFTPIREQVLADFTQQKKNEDEKTALSPRSTLFAPVWNPNLKSARFSEQNFENPIDSDSSDKLDSSDKCGLKSAKNELTSNRIRRKKSSPEGAWDWDAVEEEYQVLFPHSKQRGRKKISDANDSSSFSRQKNSDSASFSSHRFNQTRLNKNPKAFDQNSLGDHSNDNSDDHLNRHHFRQKPERLFLRGKVFEVLNRASDRFIGTFFIQNGNAFVQIDGNIFSEPILVKDFQENEARPGDKVVLKMTCFPDCSRRGEGFIAEVLGKKGSPELDSLLIMREFELPDSFPEEVFKSASREVRDFNRLMSEKRTTSAEQTDKKTDEEQIISSGQIIFSEQITASEQITSAKQEEFGDEIKSDQQNFDQQKVDWQKSSKKNRQKSSEADILPSENQPLQTGAQNSRLKVENPLSSVSPDDFISWTALAEKSADSFLTRKKQDLSNSQVSNIESQSLRTANKQTDLQKLQRKIQKRMNQLGYYPFSSEECGRRKNPKRLNLTDELIITVDPETARDFDDAISLKHKKNGNWLLGVHIADVAFFVRPGTQLDKDALQRGTSVYLSDRVIPMIPEQISNSLASLQPLKDRLTKTVLIEFDSEGIPLNVQIFRSVIRSRRRFTYEEIDGYLEHPRRFAKNEAPEITELVRNSLKLSRILRQNRMNQGALELNLSDIEVRFDESGAVSGAKEEINTESHQMIEEFMLAANNAVAGFLQSRNIPFLRRVHLPPSPLRMSEFAEFIQTLNLKGISPGRLITDRFEIQKLLELVKNRPEKLAVNLALLRSMQRAIYSPRPEGHFALSSSDYCHFTSPIRRYPDLTVHRLLDRVLDGKKIVFDSDGLNFLGEQCSQAERKADEAERELTKLKLIRFMGNKIGQKMSGTVVGVEPFGLFVQTDEVPAEGLLRTELLRGDRYSFSRKEKILVGRRSGKVWRLGDRILVQVLQADTDNRRLDFNFVSRLKNPSVEPDFDVLSSQKSSKKTANISAKNSGKKTGKKTAISGKNSGKKTGEKTQISAKNSKEKSEKNGEKIKKNAEYIEKIAEKKSEKTGKKSKKEGINNPSKKTQKTSSAAPKKRQGKTLSKKKKMK